MGKICVRCKAEVDEKVLECKCGCKEFVQIRKKPQVFLDECAG